MSILKSFVLSANFPGSKTHFNGLKTALEYIEPFDFSVVEYYCENCDADKVHMLLGDRKSVFLAAALQKAQGYNPSSINEDDRKKAVEALTECFRFAVQAGAKVVLINSGPRTEKAGTMRSVCDG